MVRVKRKKNSFGLKQAKVFFDKLSGKAFIKTNGLLREIDLEGEFFPAKEKGR